MERLKDIIYNLFFGEKVIISSDEDLNDKVVIVTGASKGIGRSTAEVLLQKGAKVTLTARGVSELKNIFSSNPNCLVISGDVRSKNDCEKIVKKTIEAFGKIDVLINSAGIFLGDNVENISEEQFDLVMDTNVKGMFLMSSVVIPFMKKNRKGLILNIGSKISHNSNISPKKVLYAVSKYAVEGFSYALSKEMKPFGVRVTCLMPATVSTFRSIDAKKYLSPYRVGEIISTLIKYENIDFESIIMKSLHQNI